MEKICFIVNPISGAKDKSGLRDLLEKYLDKEKYSFEIKKTEYAGHATVLAKESEADIICAVGGDGTQNEVAKGLIGRDKTMAIIPCGSGDGLALHLGISRKMHKAIETINNGERRKTDCGIINGESLFMCTCGMGIDAIVSWRFAQSKTRGLKTYITEALKTWKGFKCDRYKINADDFHWEGPAAIVSIGNANQWGNQARITPLASVSDGLLDITIIEEFRTIDIPDLVIKLMTGKMDRSKKAICVKAADIHIERSSEGPFHFDGDPTTKGTTIDISVSPAAITLIVPQGRKI